MRGHWKDMATFREPVNAGWHVCRCLPAQSAQAEWIRNHVRDLEKGAPPPQPVRPGASSVPQWAQRLGPIGPILLALFKFKSLFSFLAFFGFYWALWGANFGIGFAVLILIHEMGHFIDIKRRGLPADMPMFLPGLGLTSSGTRWAFLWKHAAAISLAGPWRGGSRQAFVLCSGTRPAMDCGPRWREPAHGLMR